MAEEALRMEAEFDAGEMPGYRGQPIGDLAADRRAGRHHSDPHS
jgi:hypothetical protein